MQYSHIIRLNEQFEATKETTDETIAQLRRNIEQLTTERARIDEALPILEEQVRQLETARHALSQLAATNGAPAKAPGRMPLVAALKSVDDAAAEAVAKAVENGRKSAGGAA